MATLNIDFGYDDNVISSVKQAKRAIQSRIDDYSGIKRELNNIGSSTGNLSTANTYIQKKINTLQGKYDRLDAFQNRINNFNDNAEQADKDVADRINKETNQFYKRENIPNGLWYTIGSALGAGYAWLKGGAEKVLNTIVEGAKSAWAAVKQWYEDNKHWIDVIVDAITVVAAAASLIFATSGIGAAFAVWALAKAVTNLYYDEKAYWAYERGDMEEYEELSNAGLKDVMEKYVPYGLGGKLYEGIELVDSLHDIYDIGEAGYSIFKNYKTLHAPLQDNLGSTMLTDVTKKQIIKSDIANAIRESIGFKSIDPATGQRTAKNIISNIGTATKWANNILSNDNLGDAILDSIKITSLGKNTIQQINTVTICKPIPINQIPQVSAFAMAS